MNLAQLPSSEAQRRVGMAATSMIEIEASERIKRFTEIGLMSPKLAKKLRKELHAGILGFLWSLLRDLGILMPGIAAQQLHNETLGKQLQSTA
jgi:hypothetical protein